MYAHSLTKKINPPIQIKISLLSESPDIRSTVMYLFHPLGPEPNRRSGLANRLLASCPPLIRLEMLMLMLLFLITILCNTSSSRENPKNGSIYTVLLFLKTAAQIIECIWREMAMRKIGFYRKSFYNFIIYIYIYSLYLILYERQKDFLEEFSDSTHSLSTPRSMLCLAQSVQS